MEAFSPSCLRRRPTCSRNLVIIRNSRFSDLLVGVEHNSDLASHVVGGEVLLELYADSTVVTVAGNDLAPFALVIGTGLSVF